jgi:hypothetical protein
VESTPIQFLNFLELVYNKGYVFGSLLGGIKMIILREKSGSVYVPLNENILGA